MSGDAEHIRRQVRRKKKPPKAPPPPETRQQRVLRKFAQALEDPTQRGPLTARQRAWYRGTVKGLVDGLARGAFRRNWKPDRDLIRRVQIACAVWIEGDGDVG